MATRAFQGGLCLAAWDTVRLIEAAGFDTIIIETVGVGQAEWEVKDLADTTLVVLAPGAGDSVQALKAGIMEIADIFVVNKSDLDGAQQTQAEVESVLSMRRDEEWSTPVQAVIASDGRGVNELIRHISKHRVFLHREGRWASKRVQRWKSELRTAVLVELQARLGDLEGSLASEHVFRGLVSARLAVADAVRSIIQSLANRPDTSES
jgi:LAO/AO transport system kinase